MRRKLWEGWHLEDNLNYWIDIYLHQMAIEKGVSQNTLEAYARDLTGYATFLSVQGIVRIAESSAEKTMEYFKGLRNKGLSPRSLARNFSVLKGFHKFLLREKVIAENPLQHLRAPKIVPKLPGVLSFNEIEQLLQKPDTHRPLGFRDRAMLELLC